MPDPYPTATILSELVRTHKHQVRIFNDYHTVDRACKKVIRKSILEKFYKSLLSHIIGFAKVAIIDILTHLITEYAELEEEDVQDIDWKMKESISGETLFEEFVEKIGWNKEVVEVQNLYYLAQIVSMANANINKFGLYQDYCRKWSRKTRSDKIRENFKGHFTRAFKDTRRSSRTSKTEGYVAHVHAAQANTELFTKTQQDHTLALANLTTATQADRTLVALLIKTILELSGQVAVLTAKNAT